MIDRYYIALGSTFIPCPKSYNQTRLGFEFQTKQNPYTRRTLITKENIKLPPCNRPGHRHRSIGNLHIFLSEPSADLLLWPSANMDTGHRHEYTTTSRLSHISVVSSSATIFIGNFPVDYLPWLHLPIYILLSPDTCQKIRVQKWCIKSLMLLNSLQ